MGFDWDSLTTGMTIFGNYPEPNGSVCPKSELGWYCCREHEHTGQHVAMAGLSVCYVWPNDQSNPILRVIESPKADLKPMTETQKADLRSRLIVQLVGEHDTTMPDHVGTDAAGNCFSCMSGQRIADKLMPWLETELAPASGNPRSPYKSADANAVLERVEKALTEYHEYRSGCGCFSCERVKGALQAILDVAEMARS